MEIDSAADLHTAKLSSDKNALMAPVKQYSCDPMESACCTVSEGNTVGITNTFAIDIVGRNKMIDIAMSITMPKLIQCKAHHCSAKNRGKNRRICKEPEKACTHGKPDRRRQAMTDIIESVALEQSALAKILQAEGEKIQKIVSMQLDTEQAMAFQRSACSVVEAVFTLECILKQRLTLINCNPCDEHR